MLRAAALLPAVVLAVTACYDAGSGADDIAADAFRPRVLLIGIDGVRPDVLTDVDTPELDALAEGGLWIDDARTTTPSVSGPSWSSMLTGVWPEKHGVTNNDFTGERYAEYPDFLTRLETARPEATTAAIIDWTPLVHAEGRATAISPAVDVRPEVDGYDLGWDAADERVTEHAVEALADPGLHAIFVYLGDPDETSHEHGSIGEEYRAAIAAADERVGRIVAAVRARETYATEDWLILASTDHGRRADGGHGGDSPEEMTIWVLAHGGDAAVATPPDETGIVDLAVTALAHLRVDIDPAWGLDGRVLPVLHGSASAR